MQDGYLLRIIRYLLQYTYLHVIKNDDILKKIRSFAYEIQCYKTRISLLGEGGK